MIIFVVVARSLSKFGFVLSFHVTNRKGRKREGYLTMCQAKGLSGKFPELIFSVFTL